jgi:hypothetical protein
MLFRAAIDITVWRWLVTKLSGAVMRPPPGSRTSEVITASISASL